MFPDPKAIRLNNPGELLYLAEIFLHCRSNRRRIGGYFRRIVSRCFSEPDNPVNIFCVGKMFIITTLICNIQNDIEAAKSAGSKTDDIDKTESLVLPEMAQA